MPERKAIDNGGAGVAGFLHNKTVQFVLLISLIAVAGLVLQLVATRWGPGMASGDEVAYVSSARNLSNGLGLSIMVDGRLVPMTQWAPLFPWLLYLLSLLGADPMTAARWLTAFLFAANIALVGLIIRRCTRSLVAPVVGSFIFMSSFFLLYVHSDALSEPTFVFFELAGILLLAEYLESGKLRWLLFSSAAVALCTLTRNAGISLIITAFAALLFHSRRKLKVALRDSVLFALVSLLPFACWSLFRNSAAANKTSDWTLAFHPPSIVKLAGSLVHTVTTWIFPYPKVSSGVRWGVAAVILAALAFFLAALGYAMFKAVKKKGGRQLFAGLPKIIGLLLTFTVVYLVFIYLCIVFIDAPMDFSTRILVPVFPAVLITVAYAAHWMITELGPLEGGRTLKVATACLVVVLIGAYAMGAAVWVTRSYREGLGFEGKDWRESETMDAVEKIGDKSIIYTNSPEAIYVQTEMGSYRIPERKNLLSLIKNPDFKSEISRIKGRLDGGKAFFVWFDEAAPPAYAPTLNELKDLLDLQPVETTSDGAVYR